MNTTLNKPFYITTAIDYVNARPHVGHATEKILADAWADDAASGVRLSKELVEA